MIIYEKLRVILSLFVISCVCLLSFLYCFNILCTRWLDQNIENLKKHRMVKESHIAESWCLFCVNWWEWLISYMDKCTAVFEHCFFFVDKDWYSSRRRNDCKRNLQNTICFSITLIYVWSVFIWYLLRLSNKLVLLNFFNQRDITHKNHIFVLIFEF